MMVRGSQNQRLKTAIPFIKSIRTFSRHCLENLLLFLTWSHNLELLRVFDNDAGREGGVK